MSGSSSQTPGDPYSYRNDPTVPVFQDEHPIIVFDGICVLCSTFAQFVLRRDTAQKFRFMTAQSPTGEALYRHYQLGGEAVDYESNIVLTDGQLWLKSDAAIRVMAELGWPWCIAAWVKFIPKFVRDWAYDRVARNRYRLFGKRNVCMVPSDSDSDRFIN